MKLVLKEGAGDDGCGEAEMKVRELWSPEHSRPQWPQFEILQYLSLPFASTSAVLPNLIVWPPNDQLSLRGLCQAHDLRSRLQGNALLDMSAALPC